MAVAEGVTGTVVAEENREEATRVMWGLVGYIVGASASTVSEMGVPNGSEQRAHMT